MTRITRIINSHIGLTTNHHDQAITRANLSTVKITVDTSTVINPIASELILFMSFLSIEAGAVGGDFTRNTQPGCPRQLN
jgi:hypothetical protein